jgi:hypothetical protein
MRGGSRPGAGRPKGAATRKTREIADRAAAEGIMPLDYMLSVLRREDATPEQKAWAAEKAAPYCHPKLSSIEHGGTDGAPLFPPVIQITRDEA